MSEQKPKNTPAVDPALVEVVKEAIATALPGFFAENPITVAPEAAEDAVKSYLDTNLEDLVKAAMPESPEQQQQRERDSYEETVRKQQQSAKRKATREANARVKAEAAAAAEQAKLDAAAAKEFETAVPFTGDIVDDKGKLAFNDKTIRGLRVDDGKAYSADHAISVRASELELTSEGGLLLNKAVDLPARGREFTVKGISLVTDAGVLRVALNGTRKAGGGKAVHLPAKSLLFRPAVLQPDAE